MAKRSGSRQPAAARARRAQHEAARQAAQRRRRTVIGAGVLAVLAVLVVGAVALQGDDPEPAATEQAGDEVSAGAVTEVSVTEAAALIEARQGEEGFVVLDVRTPAEFAEGHVDGAVNVSLEDPSFPDRLAELDPTATYVVYCRSGNRSGVATAEMASAGFTDVYDVQGGTIDWAAAGLPLV